MYSNLDLVNQVDSFPNAATHPSLHAERLSTLALFTYKTYTLGYLIPPVVSALRDPSLSGAHWVLSGNTISLAGNSVGERSANMRKTAEMWREKKVFRVLQGWRDELYSVYAPPGKLFLTMERSACALFGLVTYGIQMTAYTASPLRLWIPRRNVTKSTYGGMLDNTVGGGIGDGATPWKTLLKESSEEASLPPDLVARCAKPAGTTSYYYIRDKRAGGEEGLHQPEVQYVYEMQVGEEVVCTPGDDEVQEFHLWDAERVREELAKGSFKPNCALVLIYFFIRHGIITPENEPDYIEICSRLHRKLEFPTR